MRLCRRPIRAVVAIPPYCDFYSTPHRFSSLGAKVLADLLVGNGVSVSLLNFPISQKKWPAIPLPHDLAYLAPCMHPGEFGKMSFFTRYHHFGPALCVCAKAVVDRAQDICFISCFAFSYSPEALELARHIKTLLPQLPVALGGAGPSAHPLYFINHAAVDFVLIGEAEVSIGPFLKAFIDGSIGYHDVPNLYRKQNTISTPSMALTRPEQVTAIVSKTYETGASIYFSTSLTRGCPKGCRFCSNFLTHGATFRKAPLDKIQQAIRSLPLDEAMLKKRVFINFEDDNLLLDPAYFFEVLTLFKRRFGSPLFLAENGIDYTLLSPALADRLVNEGLARFNVSIASISQAVLTKERRSLLLDRYQKAVRAIARRAIPVITYFICGFRDDTKESVSDTLAFLFNEPTLLGISLFYAVPGVGDFEDRNRFEGIPPACCNGSSAYPWNGSLSTKTMATAFRLSRYCNLVKLKKRSGQEEELLRKIRAEKKLFTLVKNKAGTSIAAVENCDEELVRMFFEKCFY